MPEAPFKIAGSVLLVALLASCAPRSSSARSAMPDCDRIIAAANAFRTDHERFTEDVEELIPKYLPVKPAPPDGIEYSYRRIPATPAAAEDFEMCIIRYVDHKDLVYLYRHSNQEWQPIPQS